MKMEVLSVQNHQYQGQFGVIGSTKVKDWTTSPLTSHSPRTATGNSGAAAAAAVAAVVNNRNRNSSNQQRNLSTKTHTPKMEAASAAVEAANTATTNSATSRYAYNNNLLCYGPNTTTTVAASAAVAAATAANSNNGSAQMTTTATTTTMATSPTTPIGALRFGVGGHNAIITDDIDPVAVNDLSQRLQAELRAAKARHLTCTEVSLPCELTPRIAVEIIKTSEREPCGVRGCTIFIEFEEDPNNARCIASFKVDPNTVSTFELYLTLKHDKSGWTSKLPQFIKNLTRSSTILISPDFRLTKNKLYSCE